MSSRAELNPVQSERQDGEQEEFAGEDFSKLISEVTDSVESYCRSRPGVVAGVLFGLGFFCGWKLRPW